MIAIQNFQQRLYARYKHNLSLPPTYKYIYGNPVQPQVPLNTAPKEICIINAYPQAHLATIKGEQDVPVEDGCGSFSSQSYFDGHRVRVTANRVGLEDLYLSPLGLSLEQCWPTHLVRVFLFKDEHLAKYRRLGCPWPERETRSWLETLARQGLHWLEEELALIRPRLVITLGAEVAGVLQDVRGLKASQALLGGQMQDLWIGEAVYPVIHLAAPDLLAQPASKDNPWPRLHWEEHLPAAREVMERLVGGMHK